GARRSRAPLRDGAPAACATRDVAPGVAGHRLRPYARSDPATPGRSGTRAHRRALRRPGGPEPTGRDRRLLHGGHLARGTRAAWPTATRPWPARRDPERGGDVVPSRPCPGPPL